MYKFEPVERDSVLEVSIELVGSEPRIWRLLLLRGSLSLGQMHQVLVTAFGWEDAHQHNFADADSFMPLRSGSGEFPELLRWFPAHECQDLKNRPEKYSLEGLLALGAGNAFYEYGHLGDGWLHQLEIVSRRPAKENSPPATLIDGVGRAPVEVSGGVPECGEIMDILTYGSHPHTDHSEWVANILGFDAPSYLAFPEIAAINRALAERI